MHCVGVIVCERGLLFLLPRFQGRYQIFAQKTTGGKRQRWIMVCGLWCFQWRMTRSKTNVRKFMPGEILQHAGLGKSVSHLTKNTKFFLETVIARKISVLC